ncbi:MAG TPA: MBL fold metallo-hydrolase [Clostridia bacterium]|nr:MBL fold metallo-hydrolase [Clostridia bacterium]
MDTLLFTHMHQDHYIALPSLLFYFLNALHDASGLTIYGPEDVEDIVGQALIFAGKERHYQQVAPPTVVRVKAGMRLELKDLAVECIDSRHAAPGLCYRFEDPQTGKSAVYSGDTEYFEGLAAFAKGADVLIHEASRGPRCPADRPNTARHSSAEDAARTARNAGVGTLYLVHCSPSLEILEAARGIFSNAYQPKPGETIRV